MTDGTGKSNGVCHFSNNHSVLFPDMEEAHSAMEESKLEYNHYSQMRIPITQNRYCANFPGICPSLLFVGLE